MGTTPLEIEPLLATNDIQGNILDGFNKDYQAFLFLEVLEAAAARQWLGRELPHISSADEVHRFNQLFRAMKGRRGKDPAGLVATWMNIAFSVSGVAKFTSAEEAGKFGDQFFTLGMRGSTTSLKDVTDPAQTANPGHVDHWLMGGTDTAVDVLLIVASDDEVQLRGEVDRLTRGFGEPASLGLVHLQWGKTLPPPLTGHEHFGFKDGISQPGIRGRMADGTPVTRRLIAADDPQQNNDATPEYAKPGQPLIWPGQFVFGYPCQSMANKRVPPDEDHRDTVPAWAVNGSYVVCRRLRQDVKGFDEFVNKTATDLAATVPALAYLTPERFAALLVGRWPSGAPLLRNPVTGADNTALGDDKLANNDFHFIANTVPQRLSSGVTTPPGAFPLAKRDARGRTCPFSSHIRKVNPRDGTTEKGGEADTLCRLVLRRGIPFGDPLPDRKNPDNDPLQGDRGLMFLCYQTSIKDQFMVLNGEWANNASNPNGEGGHDPVMGQSDDLPGRERFFTINIQGQAPVNVPLPPEWVVMTGGDYFFSPGINALRTVFADSPPLT